MAYSTKTRVRQAAESLYNVDGASAAVSLRPVTSGGCSIFSSVSIAGTAVAVKASAGQIYQINATNVNAAARYLKIFNVAAASVTVGTTAPTLRIALPPSVSVNINFPQGVAFDTAISAAVVTTAADNGSTGGTAAETILNIAYK
jgi:hypothetical protein